jgi:thiol-disulfide isomerase/thioredoxin
VADSREFTLYSRSYCHLCEDMAIALEPLRRAFGFAVHIVDVDADPALEARYGDKVPVLLHGETELCHYFLDARAVQAYLEAKVAAAQAAPSC